MAKVKFNGYAVEITEFEFADCPEDSFVQSAHYADTEVDLIEEELNDLTDAIPDVIAREWEEHQRDKAEARADMAMDR